VPFQLRDLSVPIVQAPMAGGPSTPALAAAVCGAGGLGFLAAGYQAPAAARSDIEELRRRLDGPLPFGVNVFAPPGRGAGAYDVPAYADRLRSAAARAGVGLGEPRWDDDHYSDKLALLRDLRVPVVSFTFGCPEAEAVRALQRVGTQVWVTVTTTAEAAAAAAAGVEALVVQGVEAGGHRGGFDDSTPGDAGLLALLQLVRATVGPNLPLVATGGIATGAAVAAVLVAGAAASQLGTAFLLCPEAGTSAPHREAVAGGHVPTALTRAFTGRQARGIRNRFLDAHTAAAPSAYPEVHHLTAPLRAAARERGDTDGLHLWAGQSYPLTEQVPAGELVRRLHEQARAAIAAAPPLLR
jgi:nitronate monooxygenase